VIDSDWDFAVQPGVSPNKTRTGRAENRRIVVRVLS